MTTNIWTLSANKQYYIHSAPQGTDEWKAARDFRLTMSNLGAALGKSIFTSPSRLARQITKLEEAVFSEQSLKNMSRGTEHEPIIRDWFSKYLGRTITEEGLKVPIFDPRIGGSDDGVVDEQTIIEIKTAKDNIYPGLIEHCNNPVPDPLYNHIYRTHYFQMQGNMAVSQKSSCYYIVADVNPNNYYSPSTPIHTVAVSSKIRFKVFVQKVPFHHLLWNRELYPGICKFLDTYVEPCYQQYINNGGTARRINCPDSS